jgi:N-acetylmuramoyl-L-alanine amidase
MTFSSGAGAFGSSAEPKSSSGKADSEMVKEERPAKDLIVCVDPGHPSETSAGDSIQNGTTEVAVNWAISNGIVKDLAEKHKIKAILTRNEFGEKTTNRVRAEIANDAGACILLRIHCDTGAGTGITLYYPDRQGKKNGDIGPSTEIIEASRKAAELFNDSITKTLSGALKINGIKGDSATFIGKKQGALTGSIYSKVPALTVEMVYLSNKKDAEFITSPEGEALMIKSLARGIADYVASISKK